MKLKLFWQENCPNCPDAKTLVNRLKDINTELFDINSVDGMAEAAFHAIMATPSIVLVSDKDEELYGWRSNMPDETELLDSITSFN